MLFGPKFTSIFKSRWMALLWAGLIIWSAVSYVGFAPADAPDNGAEAALGTDATGEPITTADVAALQQAIEKP